jgi:hypothetical protein
MEKGNAGELIVKGLMVFLRFTGIDLLPPTLVARLRLEEMLTNL